MKKKKYIFQSKLICTTITLTSRLYRHKNEEDGNINKLTSLVPFSTSQPRNYTIFQCVDGISIEAGQFVIWVYEKNEYLFSASQKNKSWIFYNEGNKIYTMSNTNIVECYLELSVGCKWTTALLEKKWIYFFYFLFYVSEMKRKLFLIYICITIIKCK